MFPKKNLCFSLATLFLLLIHFLFFFFLSTSFSLDPLVAHSCMGRCSSYVLGCLMVIWRVAPARQKRSRQRAFPWLKVDSLVSSSLSPSALTYFLFFYFFILGWVSRMAGVSGQSRTGEDEIYNWGITDVSSKGLGHTKEKKGFSSFFFSYSI